MTTAARGKMARVTALRPQRSAPRVARAEQPEERAGQAEVPPELAASPLYGVAMLKIAMELKKADARPLDELITGVLARMGLPERDFRDFLSANGGLLRTIAAKRSY